MLCVFLNQEKLNSHNLNIPLTRILFGIKIIKTLLHSKLTEVFSQLASTQFCIVTCELSQFWSVLIFPINSQVYYCMLEWDSQRLQDRSRLCSTSYYSTKTDYRPASLTKFYWDDVTLNATGPPLNATSLLFKRPMFYLTAWPTSYWSERPSNTTRCCSHSRLHTRTRL